MAIVYLAHDLRHGRDVAIKVLRPEFAMAVSAERFLREIQIEGKLKHPNILPLLDSGDADGLLYYAMPYIAGDSLQARLRRDSPLPVAEATKIAADVADALAYAHELGVVHRDVKPGNILLGDGRAWLADFGIARAITTVAGDRLSESGLVIGTPEYMSPEQGAAHGRVDGRSDIYSLGCVLYEMLCGEPPFTGPSAQAVIARHMHEEPRSLRVVRSTIPSGVEEAIEVALAKVPADRFDTASEFAAALKPGGTAISARRRRWRSRLSRTRVLSGAAILASLGLWTSSVPAPPPVQANAQGAEAPSLSSIAVLYFEDRSESGKLGYLSAGLTEDLIDQLAAVKSLRVISPDGVKPYRGRGVPLDSLARVFEVGTLVTGTLSRSGDRLRASVRLTDAANAVQLYSGSFERPLGDLLDLRDQLAEEVARQLRIRLGEAVQLRERRSGTDNVLAWNLVRQAEQLREQAAGLKQDSATNRALLEEADSLLAKAQDQDPAWIEPIVLRGWLAYDQAEPAGTQSAEAGQTVKVWITRGIDLADRALRLHPGAPEALELRGSLLYRGWALASLTGTDASDYLARAERDLRASASVPHRYYGRALSTLSAVLQFSGKVREANLAARRAHEADAYLADAHAIVLRLFNTSLELKRYDEAERWCERGREAFPTEWIFRMCRLNLMAWSPPVRPDVRQGWAVMHELDSISGAKGWAWLPPQMSMVMAAVIARANLPDSAHRVIQRAKAAAPNDPQLLYYEALARIQLKQPAEAARLVEALLRRSPNLLLFLRSRAVLKPVWNSPGLREFL
jgi:serine/threonine-protein kinase